MSCQRDASHLVFHQNTGSALTHMCVQQHACQVGSSELPCLPNHATQGISREMCRATLSIIESY